MIGTNVKLGEDAAVKTENLVMAKDYVAAFTDSRARAMHRQVLEGHPT